MDGKKLMQVTLEPVDYQAIQFFKKLVGHTEARGVLRYVIPRQIAELEKKVVDNKIALTVAKRCNVTVVDASSLVGAGENVKNLDKLAGSDRILQLRYIQRLTYREIGEIVGFSRTHVMNHCREFEELNGIKVSGKVRIDKNSKLLSIWLTPEEQGELDNIVKLAKLRFASEAVRYALRRMHKVTLASAKV